jgi:hypothetical protein
MSRQLLRPAITWCAFVVAGSVLAGCGGGGAGSAATATQQISAPVTKARAVAYANAVNLTATDVPGARISSPAGEAPAPTRSTLEFNRCYGGLSQRRIAKRHSPEFSIISRAAAQPQLEESEVEVMPTSGLETLNNAADRTTRSLACLKRFLDADNRMLNKRGVGPFELGPVTIAPLPSRLPGIDGSYGFRIAETRLRGGQIRLHIYHDVFGFSSGPAEISLEATGFSRAVPVATERRLLLLLLNRAKANTI